MHSDDIKISDLISPKSVQKLTGRTRQTIYNWVKSENIKKIYVDNIPFFKKNDLMKWLKELEVNGYKQKWLRK